jgi:hypothetical protein
MKYSKARTKFWRGTMVRALARVAPRSGGRDPAATLQKILILYGVYTDSGALEVL